jgi:ADP-ribosylglycohydrolase
MGCAHIAFTWAFYYLKKEKKYKDALEDIMIRGGDTDTNAAIVGGLLGARDGFSELNKEQVDAILNFKCSTK